MCKNTPPTKCTALQSSIRTLDWRTNAGEWYARNAQVKKLKKTHEAIAIRLFAAISARFRISIHIHMYIYM